MATGPVILLGLIALVVLMIAATFIVITVVRKKQQASGSVSLVSGGTDRSEFSHSLAERYRNEQQ